MYTVAVAPTRPLAETQICRKRMHVRRRTGVPCSIAGHNNTELSGWIKDGEQTLDNNNNGTNSVLITGAYLIEVDVRGGGRSWRWTFVEVDVCESGRSWRWTFLEVDVRGGGRSWRWTWTRRWGGGPKNN
jgi:hypothetical protein